MTELFDVWQFVKGGTTEKVGEGLTAARAVMLAKSYTDRPAALIGIIEAVRITDDGDFTVFEWKFGQGITYPPSYPPDITYRWKSA